MDDLRELYQEVILDHSKRPRNFRRPATSNRLAKGHNPLCGDRLTLYLQVEDGRVADVAFEGSGCAISVASASLMTEMVKGKTIGEAETMFHYFHDLLTGKSEPSAPPGLEFEKLSVLAGVRDYPVRVKCATLPWHTLTAALDGKPRDEIRTE